MYVAMTMIMLDCMCVQSFMITQIITYILPQAVFRCLQTCNSCISIYMVVLLLGQSFIVTRFTVIVLRTIIISPYYNVLHKAISYCFHGN